MNSNISNLFLLPRFLGTLLSLFLFAFLWEFNQININTDQFLLAVMPGFIVLVALVIAWKEEGIGGWIFVLLGIVCILYTFVKVDTFHWGYLIIPAWAIFTGILFITNKTSNQLANNN